jgi:DNA-binding MarR family transcriptional regulator
MFFALYVCSKEIIRKYQPLLDPLGLTYTSYITLMCLWEKDNVSVKELGKRLFLDSGTLTPLLKKLEGQGLVLRTKSKKDERTVFVTLTEEGKNMKEKCRDIPSKMMCSSVFDKEKLISLMNDLHEIMNKF